MLNLYVLFEYYLVETAPVDVPSAVAAGTSNTTGAAVKIGAFDQSDIDDDQLDI